MEPQKPLFLNISQAYPCMDQTSHCKRWIETDPRSCDPPPVDSNSFSSYPFMREVCQETCRQKTENFRSNKCDKYVNISSN